MLDLFNGFNDFELNILSNLLPPNCIFWRAMRRHTLDIQIGWCWTKYSERLCRLKYIGLKNNKKNKYEKNEKMAIRYDGSVIQGAQVFCDLWCGDSIFSLIWGLKKISERLKNYFNPRETKSRWCNPWKWLCSVTHFEGGIVGTPKWFSWRAKNNTIIISEKWNVGWEK